MGGRVSETRKMKVARDSFTVEGAGLHIETQFTSKNKTYAQRHMEAKIVMTILISKRFYKVMCII